MAGRDEDRGVSEVIGFILVFSFVVIAFTFYQGIVVPDQNRVAEFDHNQMVQGQFQDLRNAIVSTAATGSGRTVSIQLGAGYPQRTIARNLGISAGSVEMDGGAAAGIVIANVSAIDTETRQYLNNTVGPFETKSVTYTPLYSFYNQAPATMYGNTVVHNRFQGTNLTVTDQLVVDGRKITLYALAGNVSTAGQNTVSLSTKPISTSTARVGVRGNGSDRPVNITIPSTLPASEWNELLQDEKVSEGGYVKRIVAHDDDRISIVLRPGVSYELRMAKVGLGGDSKEESAVYLTDVEGNDESLPENGTRKLVVEARDRFNNPVSNVSVDADIVQQVAENGTLEAIQNTTGSNGRASFLYQAAEEVDGTSDFTVNVSFGSGAARSVEFDLKVLDADGSGSGDGGVDGGGSSTINPSADQKALVYVNSTVKSGGSNEITLYINNTGNTTTNVDEVRFQFFFFSNQGSREEPPSAIVMNDSEIPYLGPFTPVGGVPVPPGVHPITLSFEETDGSDYTVREGDFAIITIQTDSDDTITYYIGITREN